MEDKISKGDNCKMSKNGSVATTYCEILNFGPIFNTMKTQGLKKINKSDTATMFCNLKENIHKIPDGYENIY